MVAITSLCQSHWRQTWALIAVITRMRFDMNSKLTYWKPDSAGNLRTGPGMFAGCPALAAVYKAQSKAMATLMVLRDKEAMDSTYELYVCSNSDDTTIVNIKSEPGDALTSVYYLVAKHMRFRFMSRRKLQEIFLFMSSHFGRGPIPAAITKIRKYLSLARIMRIKIPYCLTIAAAVIKTGHRDSSHRHRIRGPRSSWRVLHS